MSYFTDDRKMYVPLPIDTAEARQSNYFLSNMKMMWAFFAFIPIFAILTPLLRANAGIFPIAVITVIYMIGYVYFLRYVIFEERRLRKMVRELDANRVSELDHFWGIDKIGDSEEDDGMVYFSYRGNAKGTTKGMVVKIERGSTVGVHEGFYADYRKLTEKFLRDLHINEFYPMYIEMQSDPKMQESMLEYADILTGMENEYHQRLLKLNLTINSVYSMGANQRYVEYYIVKRDNFNRNFRRILETIIEDSYDQSSYIAQATILDKKGVEEFYKSYLMRDTLDSNNVRKAVDVEPFENFAKVHRLLDAEGKEVPIQLLDELDIDRYTGTSIDKEVEALERKEEEAEIKREKEKTAAMERLNKERNKNIMTHEEYKAKREEIEYKFRKDVYDKEQERIKRRRNRRGRDRDTNRNKEVREFDLNRDKDDVHVQGDESIDDLVRKEQAGAERKERGSIFNKYK